MQCATVRVGQMGNSILLHVPLALKLPAVTSPLPEFVHLTLSMNPNASDLQLMRPHLEEQLLATPACHPLAPSWW